MKKYKNQILDKIICNNCGKVINVKNTVPEEDYLSIEKDWGYFSKNDGEKHIFDLCEDCVRKIESQMKVSAEIHEQVELI
jgi:Fe2+ or Zn2+ uptake regulation protein